MASICGRSCERCKMSNHCGGCSFCEMPFCQSDCHQCFSLCPRRPGSFAHLKQVGGGKVELAENERYELPVFVPVIKDRLSEELEVGKVVGVHSSSFFSSNGETIAPRFMKKGLPDALNMEEDVEGVLQFYVKDRTLEGFWDNRHEIYKGLVHMPWRAVIAPNFSVYEDAPRVDHLYNMKRSSVVYNEMLAAGLPAVPDLTWHNKIDLDQWIREINDHGVKTISYSFQVTGTENKRSDWWKHYLVGLTYMCEKIPEDIQIIIAGVSAPSRVEYIKKVVGSRKLIILNQTAYSQSRRGVLTEGSYKDDNSSMSKNEIFIKNMAHYRGFYEALDEKYRDN